MNLLFPPSVLRDHVGDCDAELGWSSISAAAVLGLVSVAGGVI
jgi:hypothetical protein